MLPTSNWNNFAREKIPKNFVLRVKSLLYCLFEYLAFLKPVTVPPPQLSAKGEVLIKDIFRSPSGCLSVCQRAVHTRLVAGTPVVVNIIGWIKLFVELALVMLSYLSSWADWCVYYVALLFTIKVYSLVSQNSDWLFYEIVQWFTQVLLIKYWQI